MYEAERAQLERRKKLLDLMAPPKRMETAGGYVVPYSAGEGLTQLANALLRRRASQSIKEEEQALQQQEAQATKDAFGRVMEKIMGKPEEQLMPGQFGPPTPAVEPNLPEAAMMSVTDPALRDTKAGDVALALMRAQMPSQKGSMFYTYETDRQGNLWRLPGRPGETAEMVVDASGKTVQPAKYDPERQKLISAGKEAGKLEEQLTTKPKIESRIVTEKGLAERQLEQPKWAAKLRSAKDRLALINQKIKEVGNSAGWLSTGFMNQLTGWVSGTPAKNLNLDLNTLKAIAGFTELRELKDAGGTLGQVSNIENELLQSVWNNVEAAQGKEQFLRNLETFRQQAVLSWQRVQDAYNDLYTEQPTQKKPEKPPSVVDEASQYLKGLQGGETIKLK